ncbi:Lon protease family protein [Pelobacter propionicus]|uniref:endopeptidase La n=1 Tax=Pelobacter propionicus (strain DSM 2379 / NBRC 103807 / OttBd1) TaxID=338966 RepID=A1ATJ4_PELPD|nr:ATP-binding protein [Pelobacter propionicus]ABL00665.1 ATP-dependent protease, putative [Pelobacter propionicus DSM 2379]
MDLDRYRIPVEQLRWTCDTSLLDFTSTEELPDLDYAIGQKRALRSIEFGLEMEETGFNLYIAGETGTGRASTIRTILGKRAQHEPQPNDWVYVNNFKDSLSAVSLSLPAGQGGQLASDMKELVDAFRKEIPKALESPEYEFRRSEILEQYQAANNELFQALEKESGKHGFALQRTVSGLVIVPQKEGRNYTQEEYEALTQRKRDKLDQTGKKLTERLNEVLRQVRENEKATKELLSQADRELGMSCLGHRLGPLKEKYASLEKVLAYLEAVQEDILNNLEDFKPQAAQPQIPGIRMPRQEPSFERYDVNLLVDNSATKGAPVVFEANPTYNNLFGRIEHVMQYGGVAVTDFTMIRPGALHRANGGYLVIDAREVLINPFVWDSLKRCIRTGEIRIEDVLEQYRFMTMVTLKPEAVQLQAKIIMIGTPWIYYLLYYLDPDYRKFFKVKAEFDSSVIRSSEVMRDYALFVATHCRCENLLHFDRSGMARLLEYTARMVEDQHRLSSQFMEISDFIREASFWAKKDGHSIVSGAAVLRAAEEKLYRFNRIEERMHELYEDGIIMVDTDGAVAGQINGLSVLDLGDHTFGRPSRITASVYTGKGGMVNIEREAKLSGPIHDKGVMILTGYLGSIFALERPLSLSASICFEQSYSGIEGDSASSTELYALLSALSGVALSQGIAVTGSVNQRGIIQPIGGVNFKIEGFYAVCKSQGLTGRQGVIIPKANERHLMLNDQVVAAVTAGMFSIWSVETIEQGIEILSGMKAGVRGKNGRFPKGTLYHLVDERLRRMAETLVKKDEKGKSRAAKGPRRHTPA